MRAIEQIAIKTHDIAQRIKDIGPVFPAAPTKWVLDRVHAVHVYLHADHIREAIGSSFEVQLAFNYDLIPMKELELIQRISGQTVQLMDHDFGGQHVIDNEGLSHLGYHIPDGEPLIAELEWWNALGYTVTQVSATTDHTGTSKRYIYAFVDTRHQIGVYTKVISRVTYPRPIEALVEEFNRVNNRITHR